MNTAALHFVVGTAGSLLLFLLFAHLSGTKGFSAPFVVVLIGITCGSLAHFASFWATPIVLLLYLLSLIEELRLDQAARKASTNEETGGD